MSDSSFNDKEDVNSEDDSTQVKKGDPMGIEGFVITNIKSSIKITKRLRNFLLPLDIDPSVAFRVPQRDDDPSISKARETTFHTAFFEYGLRLLLLPVFREILYKWGLTPVQLTSNSWRSMEVSWGLHSRIEFGKNQPTANRSYKNLLLPEKVTLTSVGNSTQPTMTMEGMKKKIGDMRKNGAEEKRGNNGLEGS
ncbi:hypothetical protein FNV43_RR21007 [Rhamnella rubrinervis]|uniref:Uncharacterized protein n=1 Tax=Rhamnella rubrinervis TaxID=2594499 RepID=A0A8K0DX18_9ROSA|nr:hypothetical protein FNV43_RR21007 [Rhamnella rubrinervis]